VSGAYVKRKADFHAKIQRKRAVYVTGESPGLKGLKVLVIDDSKTIRRTAETLLAKEGCDVFTALDGFDALARIADTAPDIIFVDIMMPRLDGYQACSLIKHNKAFRHIPVIMLSSKDGLFDRARGRIVGSEHYLTKPFTKEELLDAIHTHISR
jgi:twitching motility two-component system response regulator PilG